MIREDVRYWFFALFWCSIGVLLGGWLRDGAEDLALGFLVFAMAIIVVTFAVRWGKQLISRRNSSISGE